MERLYDETIDQFIAAEGLTLVLFGGELVRPTMAQAEVIADLWGDYSNDVRFGHIDPMANDAARRHFGIRALPTMLVFRDGALLERHEGFRPRHRLETALIPSPAKGEVATKAA